MLRKRVHKVVWLAFVLLLALFVSKGLLFQSLHTHARQVRITGMVAVPGSVPWDLQYVVLSVGAPPSVWNSYLVLDAIIYDDPYFEAVEIWNVETNGPGSKLLDADDLEDWMLARDKREFKRSRLGPQLPGAALVETGIMLKLQRKRPYDGTTWDTTATLTFELLGAKYSTSSSLRSVAP